MKLVDGVTIGSRYRLLAPIGAGGQGAVWRAADLSREGREVALKVLDRALDASQRAMLVGLADPSLARVLDAGELPGGGYVVMERVEGVCLDGVAPADCVAAAGDVASALEALHERGLVHGDVKPANVIVREGRAVLVDLGLVGAARAGGDAMDGTLAFLAPESLLGERSAQTDLHALGVSLALCLGGGHPFVRDASSREALREAVAPRRAVRPEVLERIPAALREAVLWLLAWAPEDRPPSASAWRARWLRDAELGAPGEAGITTGAAARARPPRVGGEDAVARVEGAAIEALAGEGVGAVVVGPSGAGRRRVVEDALRRVQVDAARRGMPLDVASDLPTAPERPTVVVCLDASAERLRAQCAALRRRRRFAPEAPPVALLATCAEEVSCEGLREVPLGPLDRVRAQRLLDALHGARVPSPSLDAWIDVTAGLAGRVVSLARRLGDAAIGQATRASLFGVLARDAPRPLPPGLDADARAAAAALALVRAPTDRALVRALAAAPSIAALTRVDVLVLQGDRAHVDLDLSALDGADIIEGARRLSRVEGAWGPFVAAGRARALAALGDLRGAYAEVTRAAARPEVSRDTALLWLREADAWADDPRAHARRVATAMVHAGDAAGAAEALRGDDAPEAWSVRLDALRRAGDRGALRGAADALAASPSVTLRATGALALARDALDRGDLDGARRWYAEAGADAAVAARALEVGALLAAAEGALDLAQDRVERAEADALRGEDVPRRHRLRAVAGIIAMRRGDPALARRLHREAWQLALLAGDLDAAAAYLVNVGGAALDAGDLGDALGCLERAAAPLAALGRLGVLGRALGNLASLLAWIGDREAARRSGERAVDAAAEAGDALGVAFARGVLAELAGDPAALVDAAEACAGLGDDARAQELRARAVARCVELGDLDRARALRAPGAGAMASLADLALALAGGAAPDALRAAAEEAARAVAAEPSAEHALWHLALAEQVARRRGAREEFEALRAARRQRVMALAATLPDALAQAFRRAWDPGEDARRGAEDTSRWRRLAAITQRLNGEARLPVLLELVMDAVIELTGAERGFVLLREEGGGLAVRTARNVGARALAGDEMSFSRSVAERVAASGEALVTVDASHDARFDAAESVVALRMRSILAVPLRVQGEVVGTLYVDDRLRAGAFDDDAVEVAKAFADGAALAIHNARARRELERALRRAERLSEELDQTVARQRAELEVARESRDPVGVRGRYDEIVGRGPAMARTLALVDRVAPTSMPALLLGESGTGKELVARALHANSPRRGAAFVAENCGAIPETLLESVLFGHVRGAFTGADRARAGLFEAADGGTLFLDEVGEMSLPMQARLLRVLQEGEVRPVGGERVRKVDVRVIAATHRDLAEMVRRGTFREDLYYRLAVLVVPVPALRERREDIPALVAHFLARHGGGVGIERRALARLVAAPWPGNVRELENEVRRAAVLASEGTIREEDLTAASAAGARPDRGGAALRGTDIRDAVLDVERAMVERALREHAGNQSHAAKALGLSRFGLQKKLKRLGISARAIAAESARDQ